MGLCEESERARKRREGKETEQEREAEIRAGESGSSERVWLREKGKTGKRHVQEAGFEKQQNEREGDW